MTEIIIGSNGILSSIKLRAKVVAEVLEEWWRADKATAKDFMWFIHEITKVEHNSGAWRSGKGFCKLRLPRALRNSLVRSFRLKLPDEPGFCEEPYGDEDIKILEQLAPKLFSRKRKRQI